MGRFTWFGRLFLLLGFLHPELVDSFHVTQTWRDWQESARTQEAQIPSEQSREGVTCTAEVWPNTCGALLSTTLCTFFAHGLFLSQHSPLSSIQLPSNATPLSISTFLSISKLLLSVITVAVSCMVIHVG